MLVVFSILILSVGLACGWFYFGRWPASKKWTAFTIGGDRPWRRLGAAICFVLATMFVLGIGFVRPGNGLRTFVAYWAIILILVCWLLALAAKDMLYTRRVLKRWKAGLTTLEDTPTPPREL